MPLKYNDLPDNSGGQALVKNLYRRKTKANVPMYIIGLTQFKELKKDLKNVWNVWYYDASEESWKESLRDLIFHISLVKSRINVEKIETLFVEGITDKKIIETVLSKFYPEQAKQIYIDTIRFGGGASWVERQLFIWAKSLTLKPNNDKYLKAIGLFDDDKTGNDSIDNLRNIIDINSAEGNTFLIRKSSYKYSPVLKSIRTKGITFPTVIEDLLSENFWEYSLKNDWLISRNLNSIIIDNTKISCQNNELSLKLLEELGFNRIESLVVLYKIKDDFKKGFANYIVESKKELLFPIKYIIEDFFDSLKIDYTKS